MPFNPPIILVDTNVWLDHFLPGRDHASVASRFLSETQVQGAALVFASQSAIDVYQRVRAENKRWVRASGELTDRWALAIKRLAWDCVSEMHEIATPVPVDASDYYLACKFRDRHDDLEDDLILAACQRAKANYLVTNDKRLLERSPVDARTPTQMSELLVAGLAVGTPVDKDPGEDTQWLYRWLSGMNLEQGIEEQTEQRTEEQAEE